MDIEAELRFTVDTVAKALAAAEWVGPAAAPRVRTVVTVEPDEVEDVRAPLLAGEPVPDAIGRLWRPTVVSDSSAGDDGSYQMVLDWETVEVVATAVEFEGLVLRPTSYDEDSSDDAMTVTVRATVPSDTAERIWALEATQPGYFPVVRRGVAEDPTAMRIDRVIWQRAGTSDGDVAVEVLLVNEAFDVQQSGVSGALFHEPEMTQVLGLALDTAGRTDALLAELVAAGGLDQSAAGRVRDAGATARTARRHELFEVDDLSRCE